MLVGLINMSLRLSTT